jgi:hypothetical protein
LTKPNRQINVNALYLLLLIYFIGVLYALFFFFLLRSSTVLSLALSSGSLRASQDWDINFSNAIEPAHPFTQGSYAPDPMTTDDRGHKRKRNEGEKAENEPPLSHKVPKTENDDGNSPLSLQREEEHSASDPSSTSSPSKASALTIKQLPEDVLMHILGYCDFESFYQARGTSREFYEASFAPELYLPASDSIINWIKSFANNTTNIFDIDALLSAFERRNVLTKNSQERLHAAFRSYFSLISEEERLISDQENPERYLIESLNLEDPEKIKNNLLIWQSYGITLWLSKLLNGPEHYAEWRSRTEGPLSKFLRYPHLIGAYPHSSPQDIYHMNRRLIPIGEKFIDQEAIKAYFLKKPARLQELSSRNLELGDRGLLPIIIKLLEEDLPIEGQTETQDSLDKRSQIITLYEDQMGGLQQTISTHIKLGFSFMQAVYPLVVGLEDTKIKLNTYYYGRAAQAYSDVAIRLQQSDKDAAGKLFTMIGDLRSKRLDVLGNNVKQMI